MKEVFKTVSLAILFLVCFEKPGLAGIIPADSCSFSDVQFAYEQAVDGDVITVPTGACTWTSTLSVNKAITLKGAGAGMTIITDATPANNYDAAAITIHSVLDNGLYRITGFEFRGGTGSEGIIRVLGNSQTVRIDNNTFNDCTSRLISWGLGDPLYGVVDNNTFVFQSNINNVLYVKNDAALSWSTSSNFGSNEAVYVEANTYAVASTVFNESKVVADGNSGARIVFRYNNVTNMEFIVHGTFNVPNDKGTRLYEVYKNNFTFDSLPTTLDNLVWLRGGTGFFYDNTFTLSGGTGINDQSIVLVNYRSCTTTNSQPPWNTLCDGTASVDNNDDSTGWLCAGQPGAGMNNQSEPLYEFGNFMSDGTDVDYTVDDMCPALQSHLKEGRDFFNDASMPGYNAYVYPHPLNTTTEIYHSVFKGMSGSGSFR